MGILYEGIIDLYDIVNDKQLYQENCLFIETLNHQK